MAMTFAYISLLVIVGIGRLAELVISRRNQRRLEKQGVRKIHEPLFRFLVLLHGSILVCAGLEVLFLHRPLIPSLAISMGIVFILSNVLRWWVIWSMAGHWNVEIMDSARVGVVSSGPYRWVKHPNYVGVILEVFSLPMMHTAWITAILGTLGYMEIIRQRLKLENGALMASPEYRLIMGNKPSFFPRIFSQGPKDPAPERTRAGL
ncbi:MAG TPA: isoprenylcysteine carboxylmethyltransferase family protein [Candidatus Acidoferrales bacterium]|jgi:methyltransferase|nr:isoprenylcysteine carboxylmethyltransferase family protein [Candidatus Acidoferrales bacterium]